MSGRDVRRREWPVWLVVAVLAAAGDGLRASDRPADAGVSEEKFREVKEAFTVEAADLEGEALEPVRELFEDLGAAFREADAERLRALFDVDRMIEEWERLGFFQGQVFEPPDRERFRRLARRTLAERFAGASSVYEWDRFALRRCRFDEDGDEAIVYVRHWSEGRSGFKFRWWIRRHEGRWRVYDYEDVSTSLRLSSLMAVMSGFVPPEELERAQREIARVSAAILAILDEDWETADENLRDIDRMKLPDPVKAAAWMQRGVVDTMLGHTEEALAAYDRAERLHSDMPALWRLRAAVHNMHGDYEKALAAADRYIELIAADSDVCWERGLALEGLGRLDDAVASYRQGLADDPEDLDLLVNLALLLRGEELKEAGERLLRTSDPQANFRLVCDVLTQHDDYAPLSAVIAEYRTRFPEDPYIAWYESFPLWDEGAYHAVAETIFEALSEVEDPADRQSFVEVYLDAMYQMGELVAGYRQVPEGEAEFAFVYGAGLFAEDEAASLRMLVAAHKEKFPDDPWLDYYLGQAAEMEYDAAPMPDEGLLAEAEAAFRKGLEREDLDEEMRGVYRGRVVNLMVRLGMPIHAYMEFPSRETFQQVAWQLAGPDQDGSRLVGLIAAHREEDPDDPDLPHWDAHARWMQKDYAGAVRLLLPRREAMLDPESPHFWDNETLVRSLIHLERLDEAEVVADEFYEVSASPVGPALVSAARGDVEATRTWLDRMIEAGYETGYFYTDEFLGPALRSEAFAPLRERYPEPAPVPEYAEPPA